MSPGQITIDGTPIGGPRVSITERYKQGDTPSDRFAERMQLPEVSRSIGGVPTIRGNIHPNKRRFNIDTLVTSDQLTAIQHIFAIFYERSRLRVSQSLYPYQFRLEDERELFTDTAPPERAYLPNSLELDSTGTVPTTRHYAIYNVIFETEPRPVDWVLSNEGCLAKVQFSLVEGDILSPSGTGQVITSPTTTLSIPENSNESVNIFTIPPTF